LEEKIIAVAGVDFLDIDIKTILVFNIVYKCLMGTYKNDYLLETNSLLAIITGKTGRAPEEFQVILGRISSR
jgi:hypothetical protein